MPMVATQTPGPLARMNPRLEYGQTGNRQSLWGVPFSAQHPQRLTGRLDERPPNDPARTEFERMLADAGNLAEESPYKKYLETTGGYGLRPDLWPQRQLREGLRDAAMSGLAGPFSGGGPGGPGGPGGAGLGGGGSAGGPGRLPAMTGGGGGGGAPQLPRTDVSRLFSAANQRPPGLPAAPGLPTLPTWRTPNLDGPDFGQPPPAAPLTRPVAPQPPGGAGFAPPPRTGGGIVAPDYTGMNRKQIMEALRLGRRY